MFHFKFCQFYLLYTITKQHFNIMYTKLLYMIKQLGSNSSNLGFDSLLATATLANMQTPNYRTTLAPLGFNTSTGFKIHVYTCIHVWAISLSDLTFYSQMLIYKACRVTLLGMYGTRLLPFLMKFTTYAQEDQCTYIQYLQNNVFSPGSS